MIKIQTNTLRINILIDNVRLLIWLAIFGVGCTSKSHYDGPLSPEESVKTFNFAEDFKAEIFATEPYVIDPVSMEFDEQGNAYVVGMLDAYKPDSVKGKGRIVMLKDTNGDGRADTSIVFADSLREASSILPWNGGLIIAAAPNIMYYKDTDGDGRADSKEVLFSGFFNKNEEAQISNLRFGVDNWIYANNNGQAGEVTFNRMPNAPKLQMQGSDLRFRLDRNQFELTTGVGQFGLAIDDWGHRFFTQNSLHIQQAVIPKRYLQRNTFLPASAKKAIVNVSDHDPLMYQLTPAPYWRAERTKRRNKQFQENHLDRVEYEKDHFTAASGGTFYGGDALPKEYYGNIFTGDVAGNLVHRDILSNVDTAPIYIARRAGQEKNKEFMASTDSWVRPTSFTVGPNGDLYMIDMYRQHIETPLSIPEDLQVGMDFNAGSKYGRIYRIVPKNGHLAGFLDVDFELELIHRDEINVVYILKLLAKLKTGTKEQQDKIRKEIVDMLASELQLRSKRELIEKFINENLPDIEDADDIPNDFETFMNAEKQIALEQLSKEENLSPEKLSEIIGQYIFTERKPLPDEIVDMLQVKPKILERKSVVQRVTDKILNFIDTFINGMGGE